MNDQAEGLTDYGVWACAFTPSTTALALPAAATRLFVAAARG